MSRLFLPISVVSLYGVIFLLSRIFNLPPESEIIALVRVYFDKYGYALVLGSAFIEGLLLLGLYYPGGIVIFLGVILAGDNIARVVIMILCVAIGSLAAYVFNYTMGKYGWHKIFSSLGLKNSLEKAEARFQNHGASIVFFTYWGPNIAALISTAAGTLRIPFRIFLIYSIGAVLLWDMFWGSTVYFLGEHALSLISGQIVLIFIGIWIIRIIVVEKRRKTLIAVES